MLTQTSINALRVLVYLGTQAETRPVSPRVIAEVLGESPTYLAKVAQHLTRADILRAHKGAAGGVLLARSPESVSLLAVVQACQGVVNADYCEEFHQVGMACAFHQAMTELHQSVVEVLEKWTLADLLEKPRPHDGLAGKTKCRMACAQPDPECTGSINK